MTIDIITLFPEMFTGPFGASMLWKAQGKGAVKIRVHDLREYGLGPRRQVDDIPYGGGDGMVLRPEPAYAAIEAVKAGNPQAKVAVMSASGRRYTQELAREFAGFTGLILLAGHYEGFDERILEIVDYELSIGDYVLTGGELPAMVIADSVVRLLPGVLGGERSLHEESFDQPNQLEYPQYTRPEEFRGMKVPDVLKSGHHGEIQAWRKQAAEEKTQRNRPDLLG